MFTTYNCFQIEINRIRNLLSFTNLNSHLRNFETNYKRNGGKHPKKLFEYNTMMLNKFLINTKTYEDFITLWHIFLDNKKDEEDPYLLSLPYENLPYYPTNIETWSKIRKKLGI